MSLTAMLSRLVRPASFATQLTAPYSSKPPEVPSKAVFISNNNKEGPPLIPSRNPSVGLDEGCWLCQNNLQDFDYRDVLVLEQFIRDKEIKSAEELGICTKMQLKMKTSIRKSIKHGLLPEDILSEGGYWSLGPDRQPPVTYDSEELYGLKFADLYPEQHKYRKSRLGPIVHRLNNKPISDSPRCLGSFHFRKGQRSFRKTNWKRNIRVRENIN